MLIWLSIGAIVGTIAAAMMGDWLGRRPAYCVLCLLSLGSVWGLFLLNQEYGTAMLAWAFVAGTMTASFYGWLPLYLPELFRTSVRATGQGFAFNFGRILAAIGVLQVGNLLDLFNQDDPTGSDRTPSRASRRPAPSFHWCTDRHGDHLARPGNEGAAAPRIDSVLQAACGA